VNQHPATRKIRKPAILAIAAALVLPLAPGRVLEAAGGSAATSNDEAARLELAEVNGDPITLRDIRDSFGARHQGHGGLMVGEEIVRSVVEQAIAEKLLIQEGYRMGLAEDPGFNAAIEAKADLMKLDVLEAKFINKASEPPEEQVKEAYGKLGREIRVSMIATLTEAAGKEALGRLSIGESFDSVARDLSVDRSRLRGGDLGWVTWGLMDEETEKVALELKPGTTSGLFPASGTWRIVRVVEAKKLEIPDYSQNKDRIALILSMRAKGRVRTDLLNEIRAKHPPRVDDVAVAKLLASNPSEKGSAPEPPDDAVLLETQSGLKLTAGRVRGRARTTGLPLQEAWEAASNDALLIDEARRRIPMDDEMERDIRVYAEGMIRAEVERVAVLRDLSVDDKSAHELYDRDPKAFAKPPSLHLRHVLLATRPEAEEALRLLKSGADFAQVAKERSIDAASADKGGDIGWVEAPAGDATALGGIEKLKPGEFSDVIETTQGFAVVQVVEVREPAPPAFEAVRQEVTQRKVIEEQRRLREDFVAKLRAVAEIKIFEKNVARAVLLQDEAAKRRLGAPSPGGAGER